MHINTQMQIRTGCVHIFPGRRFQSNKYTPPSVHKQNDIRKSISDLSILCYTESLQERHDDIPFLRLGDGR